VGHLTNTRIERIIDVSTSCLIPMSYSLQTYPVDGPNLLDPFWFGKVRLGQHEGEIAADGSVTVEGVALRLRGQAPAPGTAVQVWLNGSGFFVCASREEIAKAEQGRRDEQAAHAERQRQRLNAMRDDAKAFNVRLELPVKWDAGIKDVLSGLSEHAMGDGRSKSTVEHIYLFEALTIGRLTRTVGDLLCTSGSGTNGKRWSNKVVERCHDGEGHPYQPKITCKACIAAAQRWTNEGSK